MNKSDQITEISAALAKAQAKFRAVQKSGDNKFDRYTYATLEDVVHACRDVLAENDLVVLSSIGGVETLPDRTTKQGGVEFVRRVKLNMLITHKSGQWIELEASGEGQDRADKAVYKAITGARKYGLCAALGLATTDDPEADENVGNTPAPATPKPAARQQPKPEVKPAETPKPASATPPTPAARVPIDPKFAEVKKTLADTFAKNDFSRDQQRDAVGRLLKQHGVAKLEDLPIPKILDFMTFIIEGKVKPEPVVANAA